MNSNLLVGLTIAAALSLSLAANAQDGAATGAITGEAFLLFHGARQCLHCSSI
jgi:hypothetical protein